MYLNKMLIFLITFIEIIAATEPEQKDAKKIDTNDTKNSSKWYEINMILPIYFTISKPFIIMFILGQVVLIAILLLPFKILDGLQSCLVSSVGTFYWFAHMPAKFFSNNMFELNTIALYISFLVSLLALVFSVNEKFSNLFLSISGSYIFTMTIIGIFGFRNMIFYIISLIIFFVVLVRLKKINALLHYAIVKAMVISCMICVVIIIIVRFPFFLIFHLENPRFLFRFIYFIVFYIIYTIIFLFTYYKFSLRKMLRLSK